MINDAVIVSCARTAVGKFGGSLRNYSTIDLGIIVVKAALERADINPSIVDEVLLGCVGQSGLNAFLARIVGIKSGLDISSGGLTLNRLCASGLQAIATGATMVDHGDADVVICGGAESMSNYRYSVEGARWGLRMGNSQLIDDLTTALSEPFTGTHIAITAENIAEKYNISREEMDLYALGSQKKIAEAIKAGKFKNEIVPIEVKTNKGDVCVFDTDENPRDTDIEKLAKLKPVFKTGGKITAGNASSINDAAAVVVVINSKKASELGCKPLVKIIDFAVSGVDPSIMGIGPVASTKKLLERLNMNLDEIGLIELNEAFAAQAIICIRELGLKEDRVNVNGSGIAMGHPIGATGCIISIKLINEMIRREERYGLATLCIGGGQGMSMLFEKI